MIINTIQRLLCWGMLIITATAIAAPDVSLKSAQASPQIDHEAPVVKIQQWQTAAGLRVYFVQTPLHDMLDIRMAYDAGSRVDGPHFGLANFTAALLEEGAAGKSADQIARQFSSYAARFHFSVGREMALYSLRTLTQSPYFENAISLFYDVLKVPDFKPEAIKRVRGQLSVALDLAKKRPGVVADDLFYEKLYPRETYGHPVMGVSSTITAITRQDIQHFHQQFYRPDRAVMVLVGNITVAQANQLAIRFSKTIRPPTVADQQPTKPAEALTKAEKALQMAHAVKAHRVVDKPAKLSQQPSFKPGSGVFRVHMDSAQTSIIMGQLGVDVHSPLKYALSVGNFIFGGGGLNAILNQSVRKEAGYTYGVSSYFQKYQVPGPFSIDLETRNQVAFDALKLIHRELNEFLASGPTDKQLAEAKSALIGRFPMGIATNAKIASILTTIGFYHLPLDYLDHYTAHIEAVRADDVKAAFNKVLQPDAFLTILVGGDPKSS